MKLRIRLFAFLRERAGVDEVLESNLPEPLDVAGLKRELSARHPHWGDLGHVRGVVDAAYVRDDAPLREGQEVALLPPVSGGSGAQEKALEPLERGVFELSEHPIDPMRCYNRVLHPSCGGVVVFSGVARAESRGRAVQRLFYEAYAEMAGPEMTRIFERCRAKIGFERGGARMLCVHRTGVVPVGEAAVVIAVACPHREQAFAACRFLIDALKATLPVWKKELYTGGEEWIGQGS